MMGRGVVWAAICLLLAAGGPTPLPAAVAGDEVAPERGDSPTVEAITPRTKVAIDRGLAYLAGQQREDGSWYDYRYRDAMAVNSFALLALLAGGHTPGRGTYGLQADRSVQYHLKHVQSNGLIAHGVPHHAMYSHGMSTLVLAEVYGMTGRKEVRTALKKATELIIRCQNNQGGWRYQPRVHDADLSVTVMQVMALRASRNAGIHVPARTVEQAIRYVKGCKVPGGGGGFSYRFRSGPPGFARTAAGCAALLMAGDYEAGEIADGLTYLDKHRGDRHKWYWYGHYYAAQAMVQAGGEHWENWYPFIREELLAKQDPKGFWRRRAGGGGANNIFETSVALLVLQIPRRLLPIFER